MNTITEHYSLKWQVKTKPHYKVTNCGKVYNTRTGRRIKKCLNGGSVGFWIASEWWPIDKVRQSLEKIRKETCPF